MPWPMYVRGDTFAAAPEASRGPAINQEQGYIVDELGDGLFLVNDGVYQMMFLTTDEGVIAVDAPPNTGAKILAAISSVTEEPITCPAPFRSTRI